jgi:60 kDa SS-A/Ro ribonucleoprotein
MPDVDFQLLASDELTVKQWRALAERATWVQSIKNLNTFARHDVFKAGATTRLFVDRLSKKENLPRHVFPYQILAAYTNVDVNVPTEVKNALQAAMEHALVNVPVLDGLQVMVCPDVSGSMHDPVTGQHMNKRGRAIQASKMRSIDVAGLISAAFLRRNPNARVLPFNDKVYTVRLNGHDSVMTNTEKLVRMPRGGTACHLPLQYMIQEKIKSDVVIYVSDYESWAFARAARHHGTPLAELWNRYKATVNDKAKLVCVDVTPRFTGQMPEGQKDVLLIGGFSDEVFKQIDSFVKGTFDSWVEQVRSMNLEAEVS